LHNEEREFRESNRIDKEELIMSEKNVRDINKDYSLHLTQEEQNELYKISLQPPDLEAIRKRDKFLGEEDD
jgi:hypothetical protein